MIYKKLQNVCSVAANPDKMDKIGYDFWTHRLPKLANPLQTSSPQKSCTPVLFLNYDLLVESARKN